MRTEIRAVIKTPWGKVSVGESVQQIREKIETRVPGDPWMGYVKLTDEQGDLIYLRLDQVLCFSEPRGFDRV